MNHTEKIQWCIDQHRKTNHFYDEYLPYEFHLRMVAQVAKDFNYILPKMNLVDGSNEKEIIELACFGHDMIEDARVSYNDVKKVLSVHVAEIVRAVTNYGRGRNRDERMPDFVYNDIRKTPGAVFVKLCDRIANVQYSKMTKSRMFEMYKKENITFLQKMGCTLYKDCEYEDMIKYLNNLFND